MRTVVVSVTGVGQTTPVPFDVYQAPSNAGMAALVTGTVTYNIEVTADDILNNPAYITNPNVTARWIALTGDTALTASKLENVAFPVKAVRVNITAGTGTVELTVNIAGLRG